MNHQLAHILYAYLAQAIGATIMAFLLLYFYRVFRRSYLLHWALSWGAFSLYLIGGVIGFSVTGLYQPAHPLRWGVTIVALSGGYLQAVWLLHGIYEITVGKTLPKRFVRNVIILLCSLAIVTTSVSITDPDARMIRFFLRIGIRSLLVGAGFICAAIGILRLGFSRIAIGQRLVAGVFLIYGLEQLQYFFSSMADLFGFGTLLSYANLLGILDFLMQTLMGMGMIIWLLEDERQVVVKTSESLRESEKRFRDLFDSSPDAIFVEDLAGNVLDANPAAGKLHGIDHKELFGKNIIDLVPPDQSEIAEKEFHKLVKGKIKHIEGLSRTQKGQDIPIEIHANHISYAGKPALLLLVRDITERKKAEREKQQMEAQLRQAQKLETVGRLAGGIAHDLNNILTPILCYTDMALHQLPTNSESHNDLKQVIKGANRAKDLVQQILLFSRQAEQERKAVRLQLIVREALKFLRATLPATIEIRENLDDDCQAVLADPSQMHQVVMNLCTNAYDAMRENVGCMEISLETVYVDTGLKRELPNLQTGRHVCLTVKDNGQGIQSNALEQIFEPFYTTKPVGRGTGLGLSVVHGIVMSHGGEIKVCSEPGTGASFQIYLPAIATPDWQPIREVDVPIGGKERILFVDDEKEIVKIGKRMLETFGYSVTACFNGSEALQTFRAQPGHFDLIISDQAMPELTGLKLAIEIKRIRADIPFILTTGYSEEATPELFDKIGIQACIMKPFKADDIARAIRQIFENNTK